MGGRRSRLAWLTLVAAGCAGDDVAPTAPPGGETRAPGGPTTVPDVAPDPSVRVVLLSAGREPRHELRYRVAAGSDRQRITLAAKVDVAMTMDGYPMFKQNADTKSRMAARVDAVTGDKIAIELTIVEMSIPTYDPTEFEKPPDLTGQKGSFVISDRGILESQNLQFLETMRREAQEELFLPDYLYVLPDEPVGIGAKWEVHHLSLRNGIGVNTVDTHELVEFDGTVGRSTSTMVMDSWPQLVPTFSRDPITVFEVLSFRSSGHSEIRFDLGRVMPVAARSEFGFHTDMLIRRVEMEREIDMTMQARLDTTDEDHGRNRR
jgi:hypothetical protein